MLSKKKKTVIVLEMWKFVILQENGENIWTLLQVQDFSEDKSEIWKFTVDEICTQHFEEYELSGWNS